VLPEKNNTDKSLILKYNVPAPRYTSYPTVPFWENNVSEPEWKEAVKKTFRLETFRNGISLYIHLPYCESLCTYCGCNTRITVNHSVELPYIETLLREWDLYCNLFDQKPVISEIHLGGGTPAFFSPENLEMLIRGILNKATLHPDYHFSFEAHPANTTTKHLVILYQLGFKRISIGVQDFNEKVLHAIHRQQTFQQIQQLVDYAGRIGYLSVNFDLIYGLPFQTMESQQNTLEKIISLKPDRIAYYSYAHVPWMKKAQRSFTESDLPVAEEKMNLYFLGKEKFLNAGYTDIGMDHFALPEDELCIAAKNKSLHRNFMGFTTTSTKLLIGLGVSAISDSWNAFVQNAKTIEEYTRKINNGTFSIHNSHLLSERDLIVRRKILELMCNHETSIKDPQGDDFLSGRLTEFIKDGLIVIENNKIIVSVKGKQFIRNICMQLDERLIAGERNNEMFSKAI